MSQSHNPKDSQALLQSMLQKLKLQPGREGQALLETPTPATVASTWGQVGGRGEPNFQSTTTSSVNGFPFASDSNSGHTVREIQQPSHCEVARGVISSPSQKADMGEKGVLDPTIVPVIALTGRDQLLPVKSPNIKSSDGERVSFGGGFDVTSNEDAVKSMGHNQDKNQAYSPKSLMSTDTNPQLGGKGIKMGNGDSEQSKDMQFVASNPITTDGSIRRKQRSSENRTKRWTQKIKERWRDKHGNFGKKGKEEKGRMEQISEQVSPQDQLLPGVITKEDRTLSSLDNSDPSKISPAHTEDSSVDGRVRSYSDFEIGLGSFSLLEEIATGQEWAKFLNPNLSATSVNQRPSDNPVSQNTVAHPCGSVQSPAMSSQQGGRSNQWGFWRPDTTPGSAFGMVQTSPDVSSTVSMEVLEDKQQESVFRRADLSEPMDDIPMQPADRGLVQQYTPPSFVQQADILDKSRVHPNRKRQHQSGREAEPHRDWSISAPSPSSSHEMGETAASTHFISLYPVNSPTPSSPSSFNPYVPVPRSVLKHSISQDSESSMETMSKRRRVEENRRVHFSEDVVAIEPQEVDLDAVDSEDDSGAEEISVTEQDCEVEQAPIEEVSPARRNALPAWILALKRKNSRRKNR